MSDFHTPPKGRICYGKCLRCGRQAPISRRDINTARGARCSDCGGPMELSKNQSETMQIAAARRIINQERLDRLTNRRS